MIFDDEDRYRRLLPLVWAHPSGTPPDITDHCYNHPSVFRSTARWKAFRDKRIVPYLEKNPAGNEHKKLRQIELILAWRETIPEADRFWLSDEADVGKTYID